MRIKSLSLLLLLGCISTPTFADSNGPVLRLFPTTVLEDIRETSQVAEEMENNLQEIIQRLDLQAKLYDQSLCQGADADPGCATISKQIGATYLEMLQAMEERLPQMEHAVNNTRVSLKKRLASELGNKTTPTTLQDQLLGKATPTSMSERPALRGRSGVRLSDRFKQYYDLVATHRNGPSKSLAVVAADIYLDMDEAAVLIAATREEIGRASLMEQLNQSFGAITPEMAAVVNGVKEILFGETQDATPIAEAPNSGAQAPFVSPLEI